MLNKIAVIILLIVTAFIPVINQEDRVQPESPLSPLYVLAPESPLSTPTPYPQIVLGDFPFAYVVGDLVVEVSPMTYASVEGARDAFTMMHNGANVRYVANLKRFVDLNYHVRFAYYPHSDLLYAIVRESGSKKVTSFRYLGVKDTRNIEERFLEVEEILYNLLVNYEGK